MRICSNARIAMLNLLARAAQTPELLRASVLPPPDLPRVIGHVITSRNERLYMLGEQQKTEVRLRFVNTRHEEIGRTEFVLPGSSLNHIWVEPTFRNRGYAEDILAASLAAAQQGFLTGRASIPTSTYIRNPLIVGLFSRYGFTLDPNPNLAQQQIRTTLTVSKKRNSGKIPLYVADPQKRASLASYIARADNPDWHIFEAVEEPISGDEVTIFATYYLMDEKKLEARLGGSALQVFFY